MILAVDIGNSITALGLLRDEEVLDTWSVTTQEHMTVDEARTHIASFSRFSSDAPLIYDSIVASVVPQVSDVWATALYMLTGKHPLLVGPGIKTGIKMRYNDPAELGADRIASLVGAGKTYKPPFVVVDLGTTTNFEVVDAQGVFVGGIIAAGLRLSARAATSAAAQLSTVSLRAPASVIGKNTREAIQSGIVIGEAAKIDGLVDAIWDNLGYETAVIITGEDASELAALTRRVTSVDEYLTLRGLGILYSINRVPYEKSRPRS